MSTEDVYPNEMNESHDFDDNATDALFSGGGRNVDPRLADLLGDMRAAYTSTPPAIGAELSALLGATRPTPARAFLSRKFEQMRASMLAKIGVGAVAVVAATGGLAAAGTLPAPVKDAVAHLGITRPSHHSSDSPSAKDSTTTTTNNPTYNHDGVSGVAHEPSSDGCEHDLAVSSASANDSRSGSCDTTTTSADDTTPATTNDGGGDNNEGAPPTTIEPETTPTTTNAGGSDNNDAIPPTTIEPDTTPTTLDNSGADPSGGDTTTSTPGGDN